MTWLSPTTLAVGLANGFLSVYDLLQSVLPSYAPKLPSCTFTMPAPHIYVPIHQSYIYNITSAYPVHPHLIISSSIDGYLRLTDLRNPSTDFVLSQRSRLAPLTHVYFPILQSAIAPEDGEKVVRLLALRRFFSTTAAAKVTAQVLSLAAGTAHASILMGSADGIVTAVNPIRKVVTPKKPVVQLAWFRHDWVRAESKPSSTMDAANHDQHGSERDPRDQRKGISRFTEGFKVEESQMKDPDKTGKRGPNMIYETIYEEETGITALAWNPNIHVGAWAAAGTGCGLVRVEDLAI